MLVGLYEEPEKPRDALEYPNTHSQILCIVYSCLQVTVADLFLDYIKISFVKQHLHGGLPETVDAEVLKKEVTELRQRNRELEEQVAQLQAAVSLANR